MNTLSGSGWAVRESGTTWDGGRGKDTRRGPYPSFVQRSFLADQIRLWRAGL